ncbi:CapA family protein [Jatrophihabitans sp. DSM 45814]
MPRLFRRVIATSDNRAIAIAGIATCAMLLAACTAGKSSDLPARTTGSQGHPASAAPLLKSPSSSSSPPATGELAAPYGDTTPTEPPGQMTIAFAGDVHFADRTATRLAEDPATAFGESAAVLSRADLTMVNLETSVSVGGRPQPKSFTFQAPPTAFTALRDAGIDIATMANNHAADFGATGLDQTLAAISTSHFPVVGIGKNAAQAFAPYYITHNGVRLAILAASQVQDETLANFSATDTSAGIASAYSDRLVAAVRGAKSKADVVIVYVHWGTEYSSCPNGDQRSLADTLAAAGATAVVGTHAHVLQGAGWRPDGTYVAYGLGNYFWWMSFGNNQDDNGVLTLTVNKDRVKAAAFDPSHLDSRGIGLPATGSEKQRILSEWDQVRQCSGLRANPPS